MLGICPNCEKETELEVIKSKEEVEVRGELIKVEVEYYKCKVCGSEFQDPNSTDDPLDRVYAEYRRIHGMIQPEKIKEFRRKYDLTQQELSNLLGWGGATLSRYENGALQDEAHDTILKLITEPRNFLQVILDKPNALSEDKRMKLISLLRESADGLEKSFTSIYDDQFGDYDADNDSGYKKLDIAKLFNLIIYFCKDNNIPKTKLNKLLFYADFKHYKEYTVSITGAKYAHLPFGPAPDHYQFYLATLQDEVKAIQIEERIFSNYVGEYVCAIKEPNLSLFSTTELKILATVKEYFAKFTASAISKLSHDEVGYQSTKDGEIISYEYAIDLKI
jgi:putative zinc finger/helix-turn-helix YgiT family protein